MRDDDLDEELRSNLEMEIEERMRSGMSRPEAEARARRDFGNFTLVKEVTREMWGRGGFERFAQDLHYAVRLLRKNPGFTAAVALSIAIGVGAQTAVFSVVDAVLLRPLQFSTAGRLVAITEHPTGASHDHPATSGPDFADFHDQSGSFEHLGAALAFTFPITDTDDPIIARCVGVSPDFFAALGVKPLIGREYAPAEFHIDGGQVILSYGFWQRRFGGDPHVLGKTISLNHSPVEIVGVMPPIADLFADSALWAKYIPDFAWARQRDNRFLTVLGSLKPGVRVAQARQELEAIYHRFPAVSPNATVEVKLLKDEVVGGVRQALLMALGAVALVLLIACANVANLLLARGAARQREIATRYALGASRGRMIRQFLTESLLLAGIGGALGWGVAFGLVRLLIALNPAYLPRAGTIQVDTRVLLFALAISVVAALIFSVVPVAAASRNTLHDKVKSRGIANAGNGWTRGVLVACEFAMCVILLTGTGLLGRSYWELLKVTPGFRPDHVLTLRLRVPDDRIATSFYSDLLNRVGSRSGIEAAAVSDCTPAGSVNSADVLVPGRPVDPMYAPSADACFISGGYFRTLGVFLRAGRFFGDGDGEDSRQVAIISEAVARELWPGENPIGKPVAINYRSLGRPTEERPAIREVVGVVGDVRQHGLENPSRRAVYLPYRQDATHRSWRAMMLFARTAAEPQSMARSVQMDVRAIGPDVPVQSVSTLEAAMRGKLAGRTFSLVLLGCFAGFALLLAAGGLYGVVSYAVARRVREIGIRMALGARTVNVLRTVVGQELRWLAAGLVVGVAGAAVLARFLRGMLFGIGPADGLTFAGVMTVLMLVAVAACWRPASRAARVDPLIALREE